MTTEPKPSGVLPVFLPARNSTIELHWRLSQVGKYFNQIYRFSLHPEILDDQPPEEGPDFPDRVAWKVAWAYQISGSGPGLADPVAAAPSCRTPDGRLCPNGEEPRPRSIAVDLRRCDLWRFYTYEDIALYLMTGRYPPDSQCRGPK